MPSQEMSVKGSFDVAMEPQKDSDAPVGRMLIKKQYSGGLSGSGTGQMLSKQTESGTALYLAIEEFEGSLDGKVGSFTLVHNGFMSAEIQTLEVKILQGSGSGALENISGSMEIIQADGGHQYTLSYGLG
ncbi:MAG: DUF3224 domain-containing protein [Arenicella sp.]|nr:DUF3224 domain-containing protein [Arenicella sp.]